MHRVMLDVQQESVVFFDLPNVRLSWLVDCREIASVTGAIGMLTSAPTRMLHEKREPGLPVRVFPAASAPPPLPAAVQSVTPPAPSPPWTRRSPTSPTRSPASSPSAA